MGQLKDKSAPNEKEKVPHVPSARVKFAVCVIACVIPFYLTQFVFIRLSELLRIKSFSKSPLSSPQYLIDTPGCKILELDEPLGRDDSENSGTSSICSPTFSTFKDGVLTVSKEETSSWGSDVVCCYRPAPNGTKIPASVGIACNAITIGIPKQTNLSSVQVYCSYGRYHSSKKTDVYGHLPPPHASLQTKRKANFWEGRHTKALTKPPSVIVFEIDSISRSNLTKHLPKTHRLLLDREFIDMKGFTKANQTTFEVLMGGNGKAEKCFNCAPLFPRFSFLNYFTAIFKYDQQGNDNDEEHESTRHIDYQPDYDLDITRDYLGGTRATCASGEPWPNVVLNGVKDFVKHMKGEYPHFIYSKPVPADKRVAFQNLDDKLAEVLETILNPNTADVDNTVYAFVSGYKLDAPDDAFKPKHRPFLFLRIPKSLQDIYPEWQSNLANNADRLTTTNDLRLSLVQVARIAGNQVVFDTAPEFSQINDNTDTSTHSLFETVPASRTCENANIPSELCMCKSGSQVAWSSHLSSLIGLEVVNKINHKLQSGKGSNLCEKVSYSKIVDSREIGSADKPKKGKEHRVIVMTNPSGALFQTNVKVYDDNAWKITGSIERVYANEENCNVDMTLKPYCVCKGQGKIRVKRSKKKEKKPSVTDIDPTGDVAKSKKIADDMWSGVDNFFDGDGNSSKIINAKQRLDDEEEEEEKPKPKKKSKKSKNKGSSTAEPTTKKPKSKKKASEGSTTTETTTGKPKEKKSKKKKVEEDEDNDDKDEDKPKKKGSKDEDEVETTTTKKTKRPKTTEPPEEKAKKKKKTLDDDDDEETTTVKASDDETKSKRKKSKSEDDEEKPKKKSKKEDDEDEGKSKNKKTKEDAEDMPKLKKKLRDRLRVFSKKDDDDDDEAEPKPKPTKGKDRKKKTTTVATTTTKATTKSPTTSTTTTTTTAKPVESGEESQEKEEETTTTTKPTTTTTKKPKTKKKKKVEVEEDEDDDDEKPTTTKKPSSKGKNRNG